MSLDNRPDDAPEIGSVAELVELLRAAEKPRDRFRIGMEHEKIGLLERDLSPLPYAGPASIERVFAILVERCGFERFREGDDTIALVKDGTNISLEPGCQLELSGAVLEDNFETCHELTEHRNLMRELGTELGIAWLGVGHHPFAGRDQVHWVPKQRYAIMRRYLPTRGSRGLDMMLLTGTVQANFDFASEDDLARKMRAAMSVTSIVSAIYANSAIVAGEVCPWVSMRQRIWRDVDPDRAGLLDMVFDEGFGYERWVRWALDVPMFFIRRDGRYVGEIAGTPFRAFLENGFAGHRARFSDWHDHLTTLFPEVRVKGYVEVRGADCCDRDMNCALPALWKGVLYDDQAGEAAVALTASLSPAERQQLVDDVARDGLEARVGGRAVLDLAKELVSIARAALGRLAPSPDRSEAGFLDPIERLLVEDGVSPGRVVARRWESDLGRDPRKLVELLRF